MRNSSNKKLILLSFLFMLCLLALYKVTNYYQNKEIKPIVIDNVNVADIGINSNEEEIVLGDKSVSCASLDFDACGCNETGLLALFKNTLCKLGCRKCASCPAGGAYYKSGNYCYKRENCTVSVSAGGKAVTTGNTFSVSYTLSSDCDASTVSFSCTNCTGVSGSGGSASAKAGTACNPAGITVSAEDSSGNSTSGSGTLAVRPKWNSSTGCFKTSKFTRTQADAAGSDFAYEDCDDECCHTKWCRSCSGGGVSNSGDPEPEETPACYANASTLATATTAEWVKPSERKVSNSYKIESVKKADDCKILEKDPEYCLPVAKCNPYKGSLNTNTCEDNLILSYNDGYTCDGKPMYNVTCNNTSKVRFDYNDDGTTNAINIYAGQGFKYGITVITIRTCTATFNIDTWLNAYNTINRKISNTNDVSEKNRLQKIKNEIVNIVSTYNNLNLNSAYDEGASIVLNYTVNQQQVSTNATFQKSVVQAGQGTYSNKTDVSLGVSGLKNPSNYTWTNQDNPHIVKLTLPKTYFDSNTGAIAASGVNGGNRMYLDYNADSGTYTMEVSADGIGCSSKINNNKCSITVKKQDILYRPIDISNPFINNKWTPGSNWVNDKFDFRNIIHSNIWSD